MNILLLIAGIIGLSLFSTFFYCIYIGWLYSRWYRENFEGGATARDRRNEKRINTQEQNLGKDWGEN
jgi:hypothetical protein